MLLCLVAVPIIIPSNSVWGSSIAHILKNISFLKMFRF